MNPSFHISSFYSASDSFERPLMMDTSFSAIERDQYSETFSEKSDPPMSFSTDSSEDVSMPTTPDGTVSSGWSVVHMHTPVTPHSQYVPLAIGPEWNSTFAAGSQWHDHSFECIDAPAPGPCISHDSPFDNALSLAQQSAMLPRMPDGSIDTYRNFVPRDLTLGNESQDANGHCVSLTSDIHTHAADAHSHPYAISQQPSLGKANHPNSSRLLTESRSRRRGSRPLRSSQASVTRPTSVDIEMVNIAGAHPRIRGRIVEEGRRVCKWLTEEGKICGKKFQRTEHLKRHERFHDPARLFFCPLALLFGAWICPKGRDKPIHDRSDNMSQHCMTHCFGNSVNSSRNAVVHSAVLEAAIRQQDGSNKKRAADRIGSVKHGLKNKMKANADCIGKGRLDDAWKPKTNAHINHDCMRRLFPRGFVSCENFDASAHRTLRTDPPWYQCVDQKVPWCMAFVKGGPKASEVPMGLSLDDELDTDAEGVQASQASPKRMSEVKSSKRASKL